MDTSFIDLIRPENLSKINIDNRLIEAFKAAMIRIQEYFNKNIPEGKDYSEFFNEFLFQESERQLKIIVSDELNEGVAGAYSSSKCFIAVRNDYVNIDTISLAHIICHEFIHFMAHHKSDIFSW